MKKFTLLTIASICIVSMAAAQINKGSVYLGGNLGFSSIDETEVPSTNTSVSNEREIRGISINPAIGWAIKQNLIFGVEFNYSKSSSEYVGAYLYKNRSTGGSVFMRRYFPIGKRFYAFGQVGAGYADTYRENSNTSPNPFPITYNNELVNGWNTFINFYPGISYNVSKSFFLEMGLANLFNASYGKEKQVNTLSNSSITYTTDRKLFNISSSLSNSANLNVGVRFIIPRK